jgi:peptidyl-prolyl cis-trans isomerase C
VNGRIISLAGYAAELERYLAAQEALGKSPTGEQAKEAVLGSLVDRDLLAQAAEKAGFTLSAADLKARLDNLANQLGGEQALADWESAHNYTQDSFLLNLKEEAAAAWQRDQIASQVPAATEQIHARQILVQDQASAQKVQERLNSGMKFATLALKYDPVTGGDLGWFPQGYLEDPQVEAAAFALQPGEVSQVIQTASGYHFLEVVERDPQRALNTDQRLVLQGKALQKWLEDTRGSSQIQVLIP